MEEKTVYLSPKEYSSIPRDARKENEEMKRCPIMDFDNWEEMCYCQLEKCMLWNNEKQDCNINVIASNVSK